MTLGRSVPMRSWLTILFWGGAAITVRLLAPGLQVMNDDRVRMSGYDEPNFGGFDADGVYTVPIS